MTSPNASFVPVHDFHTPRPLRLRADGRFGLEDCFQYPQPFSAMHPWATCILRKPNEEDLLTSPFAALWATPTKESFILEKGCAFGEMGRIKRSALDMLQIIQRGLTEHLKRYQELRRWIPKNAPHMDFSMKSTLTHLRDCPMTFRDVVAQFADFQCICLGLKAVLDYIATYELHIQTPGCGIRQCMTGWPASDFFASHASTAFTFARLTMALS